MKVAAILLLGGTSTRFKGKTYKQVCLLNNKPIFSYSLNELSNYKGIDKLIIVINNKIKKEIQNYIQINKIKATLVIGGKTRQESVENGLKTLSLNSNDIVLIHDGARALLDEKIIKNVIDAAKKYGAATTYISEVDTIAKISKGNFAKDFIPRESIARIQTPQCFKYSLIKEAHKKALNLEASDDCSIVAKLGHTIKLVNGNIRLHKITTKEDLIFLEGIVKND